MAEAGRVAILELVCYSECCLEEIYGEHQLEIGYGHEVWKICSGPQADFAYPSFWQS